MKTYKEAYKVAKIGTSNSKMPGTTYSQTAFECPTGQKLAQVPGTPCYNCYAIKLQKLRPSVNIGWTQNFLKYKKHSGAKWVESVVFQLNKRGEAYHRWFDSGDLLSIEQLMDVIEVARRTPHIKHWLPTQERNLVSRLAPNDIPDNLAIRISASRINAKPAKSATGLTSTISTSKSHYGFKCPAREQGNNCRDCRACWDKSVPNISYTKH